MRKLLLLCLLLPLWWQGLAQAPLLQDANSQRSLTKITKTAPVKLKTPGSDAHPLGQYLSRAAATVQALGSSEFPVYWPDRVYVRFKSDDTRLQTFSGKAQKPKKAATDFVNLSLQRYETSRISALPTSPKLPSFKNIYEVVLESEEQLNQLLLELNLMPEVAYAERVPYYVTSAAPNDPSFTANQQYGMAKLQAVEAFGIHTGISKTVLAIVDDAVLVSHPDLAANIDLAKSYDVADQDNNPRPPATGTNAANANRFSHGTHCAGIAGAVTNNGEGIAAVSNNKISIIGVKCTSDNTANTRSIERGTDGMVYAINQGARVISMSYGGSGFSQTVQNIINEGTANGIVFVAAAGNDNVETKHYPAAYDNVIAVASTDAADLKSSFSNYGSWIDVSAPGSGILSTVANGSSGAYTSYNGTSMSTPMVAGLVALMLSENPNLTPQAVTQILKSTADPLESVTGQSAVYAGKLGTGRVNALKAIQAIQGVANGAAPAAITNLTISNTAQISATLTWAAPSVAGAAAATLYELRYATAPITAENFASATKAYMYVQPAAAGTNQSIIINNLAPNTTYYFAMVAKAFYGETSALSNIVSTTTLAAPHIQVNPASVAINLNRATASTATANLQLSNLGSAALQYSLGLIPTSGKNLISYDKAQVASDNSFGLGTSSFIAATRFVAGNRGFALTHVQNFIKNPITVTGAEVEVRIYKGGTSPANATLLTSQRNTVTIPANGSMQTLQLQEPQLLQANETFWVEFVIPSGLTYPQGIDNVGAMPNTFLLSTDNGATYSDMQPLASFLSTAALKMRAISASWVTLSPASGTLQAGENASIEIAIDATDIVNDTYTADLLFANNDPTQPMVNRPLTLTVTGGQPELLTTTTALDFGATYVGGSSTRSFIVQNTGVADLTISSATFATGETPATDFTLSPATPITIGPGTQRELTVKFTPSKKENLTGQLALATNDPAKATVTIDLTAILANPPVATITPEAIDFAIDTEVADTKTAALTLQNTGEAELMYTLQAVVDPKATIKYDGDAKPENYLGFGSANPNIHTAVKFDVTTASFTLTHVQNYYRTEGTAKAITVKVYKGGTSPTAGTLLEEQTFTSQASVQNGNYISIPLKAPQRFVQGDVFYVVFSYSGVNNPQGYNTNTPTPGRNFYSSTGTAWTPLENAGGAFATSMFKVRALEMPQWLSINATLGVLSHNNTTSATVQATGAGLANGSYTGRIILASNDPASPQKTVNITMQVQNTPVAQFAAEYTELMPGQSIKFINSSKNANAYEWAFEGATTESSTEVNPSIIYTTPGKYKVSLKAINTENGKASEVLVKEEYITVANSFCNELNNPFAGTPTLYTVPDNGGFITGNNTYGDLAKANYFAYNRPNSYITGMRIMFGAATEAAEAGAEVTVAIWDNSGQNGAPGAIVASKKLLIKDIADDIAAKELTEIVFDGPVALSGNFYAGVILNQQAGNVVAIISSKHGETMPGTAWEQADDNIWSPLAEGWGANIGLYIQPSISRTTTPLVASFTASATEVCPGTVITLDASSTTGATQYKWAFVDANASKVEGGTSATVRFDHPGTYIITLEATDACNGRAVATQTITVEEGPEKPVIAQNGEQLSSSAAEGNQWYLNGVAIKGATTQTLSVTESGLYTVQVTAAGGCSTLSDELSVTITGIKDFSANNGLLVTPNPTDGQFTVTYTSGSAASLTLRLVSTIGKVVYEEQVNRPGSSTFTRNLQLQHLPAGMYVLQLQQAGHTVTRKVVVRR